MDLLTKSLKQDKELQNLADKELERQKRTICLIASENLAGKAVREAQASVFMNKYAEGTPYARFYQGCSVVDDMEALCQKRACKLFEMKFANVQPHSGAQANMAVFNALLNPGDTVLGMDLKSGGHLSHGFKLNFSGRFYHAVQYNVDKHTHLLDYQQIYELARESAPRLIVAGASSYSREIDWEKMQRIAKEVGALLMVDMAHIAGFIATKALPSPAQYADIVTTTTHKTLRGPRGGLILTNDEAIFKKINKSLMPGIQGGPAMHTIAAKAACFNDCLTAEFQAYIQQVKANAKTFEKVFAKYQIKMITEGTDNHMLVIDVTPFGFDGKQFAELLETYNIVVNCNSIPFDEMPLNKNSGIRIGAAQITSCGFTEQDVEKIAESIVLLLHKKAPHDLTNLHNKVFSTFEKVYS